MWKRFVCVCDSMVFFMMEKFRVVVLFGYKFEVYENEEYFFEKLLGIL